MTRHRIGLRREDKNAWERRVALTPEAVARLVERGVDVWVERFDRRAFADEDYVDAGARLVDDIRGAEVVIGIKEMPIEMFRDEGVYVFFSHTIKGQSFNMPMLAELMAKRCTLIDYECLADDEGRRLVYFSHHAGVTGMIDSLWTLGQRLRVLGRKTPLTRIEPAHRYADLAEAKHAVRKAGAAIEEGACERPLVIGVTGRGNVSQGAQEILELLPLEAVSPEAIEDWISAQESPARRVAHVQFDMPELFERADGGGFEREEYLEHPNRYRGRLHESLGSLDLLVHGIYWDDRFPILADAKTLAKSTAPAGRLVAVGDVTCDIQGSLACTVRDTEPGAPVYVYDPATGNAPFGFEGPGVAVMAVGNLPTELPIDASVSFSAAFERFVPELAAVDLHAPFDEAALGNELRRAVILWRGDFTPDFEYMRAFID